MDNPRTLPPLVRGKVTGVLDFFIDEIVMCKNELHLTENLDITAQVRWWGEIIPAYIRPKILQLQGKISSNSKSIEAYSHSVQYEIKTSVDLFKTYLKACEVVELSVYDGVENNVTGSAFLKNLSILLNRNNDFISMPIIDYSGEEIGQIKIHINFFEYLQDNSYYLSKSKIGDRNLFTSGKRVTEVLKRDYILPVEKTRFYENCSKITNLEMESDQNSEFDSYSVKDKNSKSDFVLFNSDSEFKRIRPLRNNFINQAEESSKPVTLPKVSVSRDSSEIFNFDSALKIKEPEKNKSKLPNKFSLNSIKSKSKLKTGKSNLVISKVKEKFPNKTVLRNLPFKKPSMAVTDQVDSTSFMKQSSESFDHKNSELESFPQTSTNKIVFDYLLGATMTKENEKSAMENFKKMSPSQDIVSSINELCLTSDEIKICKNKSIKHNLYFDLTNPIERTYYEKFFVKNNLIDFEIAELLNEPENTCAVWERKTSKSTQKGSFKMGNDSLDDTIAKKCDNFALDNISKVNKNTNNCARCKYYKKLEDLDTIIESLKHFEKNMLKQEKRLQLDFEDSLSKQGCKVSDS